VFATAGQEAFFEGHVHAFRVLGGIPRRHVRCDNLLAAVERVLGFYRGRVEADRWTAFRSHWGVEAFYCRPGIEGADEKGGVEGQIGYFRRNHLVPVPEVASLTELNAMVDQWDQDDEARLLRGRTRTVGDYFAGEQHLLGPLPTEPFETGRWFTPRVDRFSQISVRGNAYSVPVRFIGRQLRVLPHANDLIVYDGRTVVTRHERLGGRNGCRLALGHYLEALMRKPGAFPGSTALEQARAAGRWRNHPGRHRVLSARTHQGTSPASLGRLTRLPRHCTGPSGMETSGLAPYQQLRLIAPPIGCRVYIRLLEALWEMPQSARELDLHRGALRLTDEALAELRGHIEQLATRFGDRDAPGVWTRVVIAVVDL
jgi:hypothetical protein